jgi:hypothetical protein
MDEWSHPFDNRQEIEYGGGMFVTYLFWDPGFNSRPGNRPSSKTGLRNFFQSLHINAGKVLLNRPRSLPFTSFLIYHLWSSSNLMLWPITYWVEKASLDKQQKKLSMLVFWVVTPSGLVSRHQRFGGAYSLCMYLQAHTALLLRR